MEKENVSDVQLFIFIGVVCLGISQWTKFWDIVWPVVSLFWYIYVAVVPFIVVFGLFVFGASVYSKVVERNKV